MTGRLLFTAALVLAACAAQAQEAAQMRRAADLRESPGGSSRSIAQLPAQTPVTRLGERQGAWIQVRNAGGATGWVHMFDVGPAGGAAAPADSGGNAATGALRGISNLFNKGNSQRPTTVATSTIGIRGLGAEDLAQAQPNMGAVAQMEGLRQSEAQAREFAGQSQWASTNAPQLPAPARADAPQGGQGPTP